MTFALDPRQHDKLGQVIRRQDGGGLSREPLDPSTQDYINTDNGFVGVPSATITAKQQTSGSATLGAGAAWVYRMLPGGTLQPWFNERTGLHIQLPVTNITSTVFEPSATSNKIEPDTPLLALTQTRQGLYLVSPFGETSVLPSVQLKKAFVSPSQSEIQNNSTGDIRLLQREFVVTTVTKANPALVTTSSPHGYANNDTVRVYADYTDNLLDGMKELSAWKDFSITVVNNTQFTIPEDTTSYTDWTTGRCARTTGEVGVNRDVFGNLGHIYLKHDFVWVQQRTEDNNWDIVKSNFSGTQQAITETIIARQAEGDARIRDSNVRCRLFYDWIAPGATQLSSSANVTVFYWKTVPPEDGGTLGRPYVFKLANANCDNVQDTP